MERHPDHPLQLDTHISLRANLSTVQKSSFAAVISAAPSGHKLKAFKRFLQMRYGTGKLSSSEFVQFGFCDPNVQVSHMERFAGKQAQQAFNRIYNDNTWYAVTKNKLLFETLMKGAKQPVPRTVAVYDRKGRGAGPQLLQSDEELDEFLLNADNHPMFCKPTTGLLSIGSFRIDGKEDGHLLINGRHRYSIKEVCDYIKGISLKGYLFQEVLQPHELFQELDCEVISSLRFVVLNNEEGADLHSAVLKLPSSGEVADNFWRQGSVIASVDIKSGSVERAIFKTSSGSRLLDESKQREAAILNFRLPIFAEAKKAVLEAARFLPAVRVQSWDVALTNTGPVLLEVNFGGDLNLYQLASNKGVMNPEYCRVLRKAGFSGKLPKH